MFRRAPERRVWGLRAPVLLRWDASGDTADVEDPRDQDFARGWLDARRDSVALDLRRRFWSGRLSEVGGDLPVPLLAGPSPSLRQVDLLLRTIGVRDEAEARWRRLPPFDRARREAWCRGANVWNDGADWRRDARWDRLQSRPRLWAGADTLLDDAGRDDVDSVVGPEAWPMELDSVRAAWEALQSPALRGPGTPGAPSAWARRGPLRQATLVPELVLPGDDQQRLQDGERWVRLRARRIDLAVRGAPPVRAWIRRGPRGPLLGDRRHDPADLIPPAGPSWSWRLEPVSEPGAESSPAMGSLAVPPDAPLRVEPALADQGRLRLVPGP